ncbi:hypothetical protein AVEN_43757-1 [Araneus ventricosus]|uniref:Uncharacterized protein n=1 Tax=Araneus ventricosus TaxID=182803 RepID=A0A4Y2BW79_ARAVE|nr:hypothetical protein AVEN_43757-1 [Araneus ventricosus]
MTKLPRENLILNQVLKVHEQSLHDSSAHIDECSNSIKFTTPKEKKGKIKSRKAKKDASQDDNNELLDRTCDAVVLCKECSENYYKTKRKCD